MKEIKTQETEVTSLEEIKAIPRISEDCLVVIYSPETSYFGKRFTLQHKPFTIGRGQEHELVLTNEIVSRNHCRIERKKDRWTVKDLESTNGTYVNDEPVQELTLRPGDQIKVGNTILKYLSGSDIESQYHETIYNMTIMDGLTGAHNKRYLLEGLGREMPRATRYKRPLSLIMMDIDHFKSINDNFGHLAGDSILKELSSLITGRLRPDDLLSRYGGEEFVVVLPETSLEGATVTAESIRELVAKHPFQFEGEPIAVSLSLGVAQYDGSSDAIAFIKAGDEKLYEAKRSGRNRVCH